MTGKGVSLDFNGEVEQQASLPERSEHAQKLQSMRLRHPQQRLALWDPVALWSTARFAIAAVMDVSRGG